MSDRASFVEHQPSPPAARLVSRSRSPFLLLLPQGAADRSEIKFPMRNEKTFQNRTRKKKLFFVISYYKPQEKNFLENFWKRF